MTALFILALQLIPRGSRYPIFEVSGSNTHNHNSIVIEPNTTRSHTPPSQNEAQVALIKPHLGLTGDSGVYG